MYQQYIKRILDIILATVLLVITMPVMVFIVIAIKMEHKTPVFYKQERTGKNMKKFHIIKFQSLIQKTNKQTCQHYRLVTNVGKVIRVTSLDELPQVINIFKGDMSFIGPRPMPSVYDPYLTEEQKKRFEVRPGLTGLAQVHGRIRLSIVETLEYDSKYVQHLSFSQDAKIFFKTFSVILCKENNYRIPNHISKNILELKEEQQCQKKLIKKKSLGK